MASLRILLLTHEHELTKHTNTGAVVLEALGSVASRVVWRRATPDPRLLRSIEDGGVALVWPLAIPDDAGSVRDANTYVVVDGTWQQARKIYNRSPYLHALPRVALEPEAPSVYTLRRNQIVGGLCTAEAVACLLRQPHLARYRGAELAQSVTEGLHAMLSSAGRGRRSPGSGR